MADDPLVGKLVQYRRVGTFRVRSRSTRGGLGWYECEPVKAPKKYREAAAASGGTITLWISARDVVIDAEVAT